jgi:probable rRNA maturation factor
VKKPAGERGGGTIAVENRQRGIAFDLAWLRRLAPLALEACLPHCADGREALRALPEIEVTIVSDRTIARVHMEFMAIPGATDVITFEHGEIVIGAGTALAQSREYGQSLEHELALYLIHGLLHLNGYDDRTAAQRARMQRVQERVMKSCLALLAGA